MTITLPYLALARVMGPAGPVLTKLLGPLLQGLSHVQLVFVHDVVQRQEVLLQSVDQRDGELVVHHLLFRHHNQPIKKKRVVP